MLKKKVKRSIVNQLETVTDVLIMNNGRELIGRKWQITTQGDSNLFIPKVWHPYHDKRLWEDGKYFNQNSPLNSLEKKSKGWRLHSNKVKFCLTGLKIRDNIISEIFCHIMNWLLMHIQKVQFSMCPCSFVLNAFLNCKIGQAVLFNVFAKSQTDAWVQPNLVTGPLWMGARRRWIILVEFGIPEIVGC